MDIRHLLHLYWHTSCASHLFPNLFSSITVACRLRSPRRLCRRGPAALHSAGRGHQLHVCSFPLALTVHRFTTRMMKWCVCFARRPFLSSVWPISIVVNASMFTTKNMNSAGVDSFRHRQQCKIGLVAWTSKNLDGSSPIRGALKTASLSRDTCHRSTSTLRILMALSCTRYYYHCCWLLIAGLFPCQNLENLGRVRGSGKGIWVVKRWQQPESLDRRDTRECDSIRSEVRGQKRVINGNEWRQWWEWSLLGCFWACKPWLANSRMCCLLCSDWLICVTACRFSAVEGSHYQNLFRSGSSESSSEVQRGTETLACQSAVSPLQAQVAQIPQLRGTSQTPEGRSATFRVQGSVFFSFFLSCPFLTFLHFFIFCFRKKVFHVVFLVFSSFSPFSYKFAFLFMFSCFFLLSFLFIFWRFCTFVQVKGNGRDGWSRHRPTNQSFRVFKVHLTTVKVAMIEVERIGRKKSLHSCELAATIFGVIPSPHR